VNYIEIGPDERIESTKPNELTFYNTYLKRYVKEKEINLVIENLEIGYLPEDFVKNLAIGVMAEYKIDTKKIDFKTKEYELNIGENGSIEIIIEKEKYQISTFFSYPGDKIGFNSFSSEKDWDVKIEKIDKDKVKIEGENNFYKVERVLTLKGEKIEIEDNLKNKLDSEIGVIIKNKILTPVPPSYYRLAGVEKVEYLDVVAPNPTIFISQDKSSLGFVAEDNILRLQGEMRKWGGNSFEYYTRHFGLDKNKEYKFCFSLYPIKNKGPKKSNDYFAFINKVRRDWDTNFTIEGPIIMGATVIPERKAKGYMIYPWLSTNAYNPKTDKFYTMEEIENQWKSLKDKIRKSDPNAYVLGVIEGNLYAIDKREIPGGEKIGQGRINYGTILTKEETKLVEDYIGPLKDSVLRTEDGRMIVDTYYPSTTTYLKNLWLYVMVYYIEGNYRYKQMLEYLDFIFDKIGCDGVYIDQFELSYSGLGTIRDRCTYEKWDGYTVDIDENTGKIKRKYTDLGLVSIPARKKILDYALSKGKIVVLNGYACARELQNLRNVFRFAEMENDFPNPLNYINQEPPVLRWCAMGHLSTPIIYGLEPAKLGKEGSNRYAEVVIKGIITALKNGLLYYPHAKGAIIPKEGEGAGEYGPMNHMFPITIEEINEGYIIGKERIISCVSKVFKFNKEPKVYLFDLKGREKEHNFKIEKKGKEWEINVKLNDWNEICIIE
ncbi:MAG: hypothetical protein NC926_11000, partial [Candidatus Omnitrophica bacterium]|nr:hypothetical protein [Candidatus Omnitrophota bacterium]